MAERKQYLVTFSSGAPDWNTSKWIVTAEEKSEAINLAMLMHDDHSRPADKRWPVAMLTLSYRGANPSVDESQFTVVDPDYVDRLLRIYLHGKERLENC
jgi:hypothetical protein